MFIQLDDQFTINFTAILDIVVIIVDMAYNSMTGDLN